MASNSFCMRLINWPIIVAGGASGIGKAAVKRFVSEGAIVQIFDINEKGAGDLCDSLVKNVSFQKVDVSEKEECINAVNKFANDNDGIIRGLVNSVAYFGSKSFAAEKADWDKSFSVNVIGYANMIQACHPYMREATKRNLSCSIVNTASISAHIAQVNRWTYAATKGAILSMSRCMALDLSRDHIRLNSLSPSWVWTPEVEKAAENGGRKKWEPIWGRFHMMNRICEPDEVASTMAFLLSDDSSFITGADIPCDGGYMTIGPERFGEESVFSGAK